MASTSVRSETAERGAPTPAQADSSSSEGFGEAAFQFVKRISSQFLTCGSRRPGSALPSPFHQPPKVEMLGEFSIVTPGLLGIAKRDKRSWVLICALSGKELLRGGGSAVVYELQSTDAKGNQERIMLQKTDEVKDLDHQKFECTLVSMAHGDEPDAYRFSFASKEDFSKWTLALMVAIQESARRTKKGTLLQLMESPAGQEIKVSAEL